MENLNRHKLLYLAVDHDLCFLRRYFKASKLNNGCEPWLEELSRKLRGDGGGDAEEGARKTLTYCSLYRATKFKMGQMGQYSESRWLFHSKYHNTLKIIAPMLSKKIIAPTKFIHSYTFYPSSMINIAQSFRTTYNYSLRFGKWSRFWHDLSQTLRI
jgi:hypothetical protein